MNSAMHMQSCSMSDWVMPDVVSRQPATGNYSGASLTVDSSVLFKPRNCFLFSAVLYLLYVVKEMGDIAIG